MDPLEGVRRVREIAPMIGRDLRTAIRTHAIMEAINNIVPSGMSGIQSGSAPIFNSVQNALGLKVALDIARIFDVNQSPAYPVHKQDKASLPVLAALLSRADVRSELEANAAEWVPLDVYLDDGESMHPALVAALRQARARSVQEAVSSCHSSIDNFLQVVSILGEPKAEATQAIVRLREFRNRRLAHSLFDKTVDEAPRFRDLDVLLILAKEATAHALHAVNGANRDFVEVYETDRSQAEEYAASLLDGLKRASGVDGS